MKGQINMGATLRSKVEEKARSSFGWEQGSFESALISSISVPSFVFFTLSHKTLPFHEGVNYVLLPNGELLAEGDKHAIEQMLNAGLLTEIGAPSLAEVLRRFHPDVGPGLVLHQPTLVQEKFSKLLDKGTRFFPPEFLDSDPKQSLHFYLMNADTNRLYLITASLHTDHIHINKTKVL